MLLVDRDKPIEFFGHARRDFWVDFLVKHGALNGPLDAIVCGCLVLVHFFLAFM